MCSDIASARRPQTLPMLTHHQEFLNQYGFQTHHQKLQRRTKKTNGLDSRCTVSGAFSELPMPRQPQTMSMLTDTSVNTIRFQWPRFPFHKQSPQLRNQVYTPKRRTDKIFWLKPFLVFVCFRARRYVQCRQETMQGTLRGALLVGGQAFGISGSMPQKRRSMPQCAGSKSRTD